MATTVGLIAGGSLMTLRCGDSGSMEEAWWTVEVGMISYGNHGGRDGGAGRITGGHDGRPDDISMAGDGIDSGGDGIRWC